MGGLLVTLYSLLLGIAAVYGLIERLDRCLK